MGQKVTFDPYTKTILVTVAPVFDGSNWVVELDVKIDIYSDGKEDWKTDTVLNKLLFPVKAIGGNELPGSKSLGSTFFLDYGWKIKPYEANHVLKVNGNMYARDGSSPYSTTDGSYNVQIIQSVSSLVDSTVQQLAEIERMSFNEGVTIDITSSNVGTAYPIGSVSKPSNNFDDTFDIAVGRGFSTFYVIGDLPITGAVPYVDGYTFIGSGKDRSLITIDPLANVHNCTYYDAHVTGTLDGDSKLKECVVDNLNYIKGYIELCVISSGTITLGGNETAHFLDCWSGVPGASRPTIDLGGTGQSLALRNYNGGINLINKSGTNDKVSIDLNSGTVVLYDSVTAGEIVIRGIGELLDEYGNAIQTGSWNGCTIFADGLMSKDTISGAVLDSSLTVHDSEGTVGASLAAAAYNGILYIDINSSNTGTVYPVGTWGHPVNNIADADIISSKHEINTWHFHSGMTITNGIDISNRTIEAHVGLDSYITLETGVVCDNTIFRNIKLKGDIDGICTYSHCEIDGVTNMQGSFDHCIFEGANSLKSGYSNIMQIRDCMSYSSSVWTSLDIGDNQVNVVGWLGLLQIGGKDGVNELTLHGSLAYFYLLPTCTAGDVIVSGRGRLLDTSDAGCTVASDYMYNTDIQADKVWEELSADHTDNLTMGGKLNTASSGGVDYNALGDAVWDHSTATNVVSVLNNVETMSTRILGLSQENFKFFGHVYDSDGNLTSANIRIYPTSTDVENNTNHTASYRILASYTDKKLTDYQVLKI